MFYSFNPYSNGTITSSIFKLGLIQLLGNVSILILMELLLHLYWGRIRRNFGICFNPYSNGTITSSLKDAIDDYDSKMFQSLF